MARKASCATFEFELATDFMGGICVKKFLVLVLVLLVVFSTSALACDCNCGCYRCDCEDFDKDWRVTTLVVAGQDWDYDIKVNARKEPDIDAKVSKVLRGGTVINVTDFFYTDDGRIWAEFLCGDSYAYVSMKYLEVLPEGSYFYISEKTAIRKYPSLKAAVDSVLIEEQEIYVSEVVENAYGFWAKVPTEDGYGYVRFLDLEPLV